MEQLTTKLGISTDTCEAFKGGAVVGTKVRPNPTHYNAVLDGLDTAVAAHNFMDGPLVQLPAELYSSVWAGEEPRTDDTGDYVVRPFRGRNRLFLRRMGLACKRLQAVVMTIDEYMADPDVVAGQEKALPGVTHVLVTLLGSSRAEGTPMTEETMVRNMAGHNNRFVLPAEPFEAAKMALDWVEMAKDITEFWRERCVVWG